MNRKVKQLVRGTPTVDGAGVHLVRVLGHDTVEAFDPFLMLDSFDSENPAEYIAGFPFHPHRGIETISYLVQGEMAHEDSLGNKGMIRAGESQWMTSGSGIMHQEMPQPAKRMLGVQIWLNMAQADKMTAPAYFDIHNQMIGEVDIAGGHVRVLSGEFHAAKGVTPPHHSATIYDVALESGADISISTIPGENAFVFLLEGGAIIDGQDIPEKTAVLFEMQGDTVAVRATEKSPLRFLYFSGKPLREPVAWGGPIVMNTREELRQAFRELEAGTFIK